MTTSIPRSIYNAFLAPLARVPILDVKVVMDGGIQGPCVRQSSKLLGKRLILCSLRCSLEQSRIQSANK